MDPLTARDLPARSAAGCGPGRGSVVLPRPQRHPARPECGGGVLGATRATRSSTSPRRSTAVRCSPARPPAWCRRAARTTGRPVSARRPPPGRTRRTSMSGRSRLSRKVRYSTAAPWPTQPMARTRCTSAGSCAALAHPRSRAVISQDRGVGKERPCSVALPGTAVSTCGLALRKPPTRSAHDPPRLHSRSGTVMSYRGHEPANPARTTLLGNSHGKWQKRLARGGARSQPSAAISGGLAAATTEVPSPR